MILLCPPAVVNCDFGAFTKATSDCVGETLKETIPETNVVPSVGTFVAPATATYFDTSAAPETIIDHNVSDISYQMNTTEKENTTKVIMTGNNSADHCVVNSQFDESMKIVSKNLEDS